MAYEISAGVVGNTLGSAIQNLGSYSAQAAARANGVSAAAQSAQGAFNQSSANLANSLGTDRILDQYNFNSGQAMNANDFTMQMWDKAAAWNEEMWQRTADWNEAMLQKQMDFNSGEAKKSRQWQQKMMETAYQRAVADMEKAGINPILAANGISTGVGSANAASIGGTSMGTPSMSGAQGQMASGGLMNGLAASEGNYTGQMEYLSGILGLLSAGIGAMSSAFSTFGSLGDIGKELGNAFADILKQKDNDKYGYPILGGQFRVREGSLADKFLNPTYKNKQ